MPIGNLSWSESRPKALIGDGAADRYLVILTRPLGFSSDQWLAVYLGTGAVAQVGTYGNMGDAMNGCTVHFNGLAA
jgi:hypothetical protein